MFYLKLSISGLLIITFYGLVSCSVENINKQLTPQENSEQLNETLQVFVQNANNSRSARTLLPHPRTPGFTLRRRQPIKIRARADHFPLRTQIRRVHNGLPNAQPQQQNMRYGYESLKSSKYASSSKGANPAYLNNGKGSPHYRPQLLGGHPNSIHVPALSQQYIHNFKASPAFNGQVVVHPATQKQKQQQQPTTAQQDNAYPKYVKPQQQQQQLPQTAAAAVPPQSQQQQQPQQQPLTQYPDFKQYPIPDQEKMQQYNEQHEKYLQQQKYLTPKNPIAYYQLQHTQQQQQLQQQQQQQQQQLHQELPAQQQPQLQQNYAVHQPQQYLPQSQQQQPSIPIHESAQTSNINNVAFPAAAPVPPKMYSVYEENDMTELQNNNYQTATYQGLDKEAQEYLRFMNTNEYFLPKKDPNYKQIDEETDKRQYNVLKAQQQQHLHSLQQSQAPTPYQQSQPIAAQQTPYSQPEQQQQQIYAPSSSALQTTQYSNSIYSDLSDPSSYNLGNPVSQLYYQQDPSTAASSTVVRTSYQTGYNQNQFVVNSQNNKVSKYTVPSASTPSSIVISTQAPHVYAQLRHNSAGNRTPEPLRFEFTERDAMVGGVSYTHAPQGQLRYNALASNSVTPVMDNEESSTVSSLGSKHYSSTVRTQNYVPSKHTVKQVTEDDDDPEDGDDMQEAGTNLYGRQPVVSSDSKKTTSTTEAPPSEQKDTEEYCERICAIVEDENEEIVCGSDGYMYTSEAQMECYASCLHIDVTIQGKGSCSTR